MPRKPKCAKADEVLNVTCVKRKKSSKRKYKKRSPGDKKIRPRPKSPGRRKKSQRSRARGKTRDPSAVVMRGGDLRTTKLAALAAGDKGRAASVMRNMSRKFGEMGEFLDEIPQDQLKSMIEEMLLDSNAITQADQITHVMQAMERDPALLNNMINTAAGLLRGPTQSSPRHITTTPGGDGGGAGGGPDLLSLES